MIKYSLYDQRYLIDPDSSFCFEVCETLKEANKNKKNYGNDIVVVKESIKRKGKAYIVIDSNII